ncbi:MAG: hypothetical protein KBC64_07170 [Simkaniaceae bacterium]|nr:hypothetical protein [Simkaniaceae bacterium]
MDFEKIIAGACLQTLQRRYQQRSFSVESEKEDSREIWTQLINSQEEPGQLFYHLLIKSIDAILSAQYTYFDGQTTSNCCHGLSVMTMHLIEEALHLDLKYIREEAMLSLDRGEFSLTNIPSALVDLVTLYLITFTSEISQERGRRTIPENLKLISGVGTKFCRRAVAALQKFLSNKVAKLYFQYSLQMDINTKITKVPVSRWAYYVRHEFLRQCQRGVLYAPCKFSMQVIIAHLIQKQAYVVLCADLVNSQGEKQGASIFLFYGDGNKSLIHVPDEELDELEPLDYYRPVVVFGGCTLSDNMSLEEHKKLLATWKEDLSGLVLACDIHYPHFPEVRDDPTFDSSKIEPQEEELKEVIYQYSSIRGVTKENPSLFCLNHIFPASLAQVLLNPSCLPDNKAFLPKAIAS